MVLARELTLQEIATIAKNSEIELEAFVHGAMCVSYSGRCLISNYLAGRDSNGGACAQPCRWSYALMEEKRPGVYLPVEEDMALVEAFDSERGAAKIRQRGKFYRGDRLELISPGAEPRGFIAEEIRNEAGELVESTPHADERLTIKLPFAAAPFAMIRKKME